MGGSRTGGIRRINIQNAIVGESEKEKKYRVTESKVSAGLVGRNGRWRDILPSNFFLPMMVGLCKLMEGHHAGPSRSWMVDGQQRDQTVAGPGWWGREGVD